MEDKLKEYGLHIEHSEADDREKIRRYKHDWYLKHRDEVLARSKKRYEEHKDEIKDYKKQHHLKYYAKNREKILEYGRKWHWENRDRVLNRKAQYRDDNKEKIKELNKEYRKNHTEQAREYQRKNRATKVGYSHNKVWQGIKKGEITKQPCESCGADIAEAHHDDYNKPLEIRWLCKRCHAIWHKNNKPIYIKKEMV